MNRVKFTLLTAGFVLAMAFTFSCSGDDGGGGKEVIATISSTIFGYDASGAVSTNRTEYEYDSKGNQIKVFQYGADGNGGLVLEYEYDSRGNLVKEIQYSGTTILYEYDCNSNICTCNMYNSMGEGTIEVRYTTINSKRLEASRIITYSNGSVTRMEYEYDSKGNTTNIAYYDASGSLTGGTKYENHEYDSRGNVTRLTGYYVQQEDGSYVKFVEQTSTYTYKTL